MSAAPQPRADGPPAGGGDRRRPVALVTSRSFGSGRFDPEADLRAAGLRVERGPADHDLERLRSLLPDAVAWIAGTGPVTAAHLEAAPALRIVARYGVGVDAVDVAAAAAREVRVTNTPGANSDAVADHTVALLLGLLRGLGRRPGADGPPPPRPRELGALTVGLVGLGQVGRRVAGRLAGFGSRLLAHDPVVAGADAARRGVALGGLEEIAAESDVLSLHRPGGEVVVDDGLLAVMTPDAVVVNTARGDLVDEPALARALAHGRLAGYATDVGAGDGPLAAAPNVLRTDHVAAHTVEAIDRMGRMAAEEVLRALRDEPARSPVRPGAQELRTRPRADHEERG